jgi:hypothetical protein
VGGGAWLWERRIGAGPTGGRGMGHENERRKRLVGWLGKKGKRIFPFKNLGILGWKFYGDLRGTQGEYWRREREKEFPLL